MYEYISQARAIADAHQQSDNDSREMMTLTPKFLESVFAGHDSPVRAGIRHKFVCPTRICRSSLIPVFVV